jgi:hypothetical protein
MTGNTENAQAPVGGLAPLGWSKEASISSMQGRIGSEARSTAGAK